MSRRAPLCLLLAAALLLGCGAARQHKKIKQDGEVLRFELAELYVDKGVPQAAVPLLQKILTEDPKDVRARVLYANVLRDIGLLPQAEREYRYALQLAPGMAAAHAGMGILADLQRRPALARRHHLRAVRLDPGNAAYRNNLGFSLYLAGKLAPAIVAFEQALAMDPGLSVAYNNLGFAYGKHREFTRAERTFRAGNGEAAALLNMAIVWEEHGCADRAASLRRQAYRLDPDLEPTADDVPESKEEATP
jgi:Flp pilus assembly protein TadD